MSEAEPPGIVIIGKKIDPAELARLVNRYFVDMVKYVVDVRRNLAAVGGELHADAEQLLLASGSRQEDLWGANYYPDLGRERCIEYTALINIRPSQDNPSMEVEDSGVRETIARITYELIGRGEAV
jgi:hypothetical protein